VAPSVPYLGTSVTIFGMLMSVDVFLDEIAYVDSFNPDIGKGGIINFSKHRKIARLIRNMETYQTVPYKDIQPSEPIQNLLHSQVFDDDNLQKKSLNCEKPSGFD
jgi:hypothetical protein